MRQRILPTLIARLLITFVLTPSAVRADTPAVTPPRIVEMVEAVYPSQALAAPRAATVELVLAIDADGVVTDVEVTAAAGDGFDEAAAAAARRFRFEPARRDGVAIASRIRYEYVFAPPPAAHEEAPPESPAVAHGRLEGRVLDRAGGEPIAGAEVLVEDERGGVVATGATDGDGAFAFDALVAGRYRVRVTAFEYGTVAVDETVGEGIATSATYRLDRARDTQAFGATAVVDAPAREVTTRKLRGAELTQVAGTRGDALRSIELLPGVARPAGGQGALMVRGSSPWDSGIFLEGADIPMLYHFGGLTSFVPSGLLESIDFYPGNFSVRYGRRMGGVIEVGLREPRADRVHAVADVNMLDAAVQLEGPITPDVSFVAAARRSYIDAWFTSVVPADEIGVTSAPVYLDWQLLVQWKPTERDRIRVSGYGADDRMALVAHQPDDRSPAMRGRVAAETGFHRAALAWTHRYASTVEQELSLAVGPFYIDFDLGPALSQRIGGTGVYSRAEWRAALASWLSVTGGADLSIEWGHITLDGPMMMQAEGNPDAANFLDSEERAHVDADLAFVRPAIYVESSMRPGAGLELIAGLRSDYFGEIDQLTVDPRVVVRKALGASVVAKAGVGRFSQPPDHGETIAGLGNPDLEALSAIHTSAGVEWAPRERTSFGLDAFHKRLTHLVVGGDAGLTNGGKGRIYGVEASARLAPGGRFSGFLSYTLSRSERNDTGMSWRRFDFDQTHILSASGMARVGRGWTLGTTLRLASGSPDTPVVDRVYDADRDLYRPVYGAVNSERHPLFHQLDLRVEKQWRRGWGNVAAYLDVQNAYNARHVEGRAWNYDYTRSAAVYGLPVLPSLGLRGEL